MKFLIKILAGAIPAAVILLSGLVFVCYRRRHREKQQQFISQTRSGLPESPPPQKPIQDHTFHAAIAKLRLSHKSNTKSSLRFHHLHQQNQHQLHPNLSYQQTSFNWDDHPRLIAEAAESGWSRFVFAARTTVPRSSPLWGLCAACDGGRTETAEINWEVPPGSSEFMQTVRINPQTPKKNISNSNSNSNSPLRLGDQDMISCCYNGMRMSLPLPGPALVGTSFPQESYFEITVLYLQPHHRLSRAGKRAKDGRSDDGDKAKLIQENSVETTHSDASVHAVDDEKIQQGKHDDSNNQVVVSMGLTRGGSFPSTSSPGTYPGSIGFNSNGSVYLDGMKLVSESERTSWAGVNRVVGCGFNPSKKKVFLTVDAELVHVIRCSSDAYKHPLYPVLAANSDVMVLVNLGQAAFKYAPANAHRTSNPCFARPTTVGSGHGVVVGGYEDSRELFSVGRLDSERLDDDKNKSNKSSRRSSRNSNSNWDDGSVVVDLDGESDLFEIQLQN